MTYLLYLLIAIAATTIGAITGMGGGVFMKPILDILGDFSVATISMLSTITVFCMSLVSVFRQRKSEDKPAASIAVPLAIGAVVGGNLGNTLLNYAIGGIPGAQVTFIQNAALAVLILFVMVYMFRKDRIKSPGLTGVVPSLLAGLFLGFCSSFLGIGGGPINVALLIFLFNFPTKKATACSLITILFSQAAKLIQTALTVGFAGYQLQMAPVMVIGAIAGGLIGAAIAKKLDESRTDKLFQAAQVLILVICATNMFRSGL